MLIETTISKINKALISALAVIDSWFDQPETILKQRSAKNDWSPAEILEHIMLTNRFFLDLIDNGGRQDIFNANGKGIAQKILASMRESEWIREDVEAGSFLRDSCNNMIPTGTKPLNEIREALREQLYRCMCQLELLQYSQDTAYENGSHKTDACQYIYFLALHAKQHAEQLEKYAPCQSESGCDGICI